jgi:hypothetical protein
MNPKSTALPQQEEPAALTIREALQEAVQWHRDLYTNSGLENGYSPLLARWNAALAEPIPTPLLGQDEPAKLPSMDVNAADRARAGRTKRRAEWRVVEDLMCRERQLTQVLTSLAAAEKWANAYKLDNKNLLAMHNEQFARRELAESKLAAAQKENDRLDLLVSYMVSRAESAESKLAAAQAEIEELKECLRDIDNTLCSCRHDDKPGCNCDIHAAHRLISELEAR